MKTQIPDSTFSERLNFVSNLKNYISIFASSREVKQIFGTSSDYSKSDRNYKKNKYDKELSTDSHIVLPTSLSSVNNVSNSVMAITNVSLISKASSTTSTDTTESNDIASSANQVAINDIYKIDQMVEQMNELDEKPKSIYFLNTSINDSCIVNKSFSSVNYDFEENTWFIGKENFSPSIIISNETYDLISPKSQLLNYFSTISCFIFRKLQLFFPYELPNRYAFELSCIFISKYHKLDMMYQIYKMYHKRLCKFIDAAVIIIFWCFLFFNLLFFYIRICYNTN